MKVNVAIWDRILRFILGVIGLTWAIAGGPFWSFISLYLIVSSAWGVCPLYGLIKVQTYRPKRLDLPPG